MRKRINIMNWSKLLSTDIQVFKKTHKLPQKTQIYLLNLLHELLSEGFSLNQSIQFMTLLIPKYQQSLEYVNSELMIGHSFESTLEELGFSLSSKAQIFYAQRQGNFIDALKVVATHLQTKWDYRNKMIKALIYPTIMAVALVILLFGMRAFLLPHITSFISAEMYEEQIFVRLIIVFFTYLPQIFGLTISISLILWLVLDFYILRLPLLKRFKIYHKIPIIRHWTISYCTYKLAKQLGSFFASGYSILQIVETLETYPIDPFLTEISKVIRDELIAGTPLPEVLEHTQLFTEVFPIIVKQGELTSQTAQKCLVYSDKLFHDLLTDIAKKMSYIQPILFILIAVLIMAMYLLMMLPMLTMEGF